MSETPEIPLVATYRGKLLDGMSKAELIAVIHWQESRYQSETAGLRESREMWMRDAFALAKQVSQ